MKLGFISEFVCSITYSFDSVHPVITRQVSRPALLPKQMSVSIRSPIIKPFVFEGRPCSSHIKSQAKGFGLPKSVVFGGLVDEFG
jgi:hypothetical protein